MRVFVRLLEEHAERCVRLADKSQDLKVQRLLRLLAVDLMLGAEHYRAKKKRPLSDQLAELNQLSRTTGPQGGPSSGGMHSEPPDTDIDITSESASTA